VSSTEEGNSSPSSPSLEFISKRPRAEFGTGYGNMGIIFIYLLNISEMATSQTSFCHAFLMITIEMKGKVLFVPKY